MLFVLFTLFATDFLCPSWAETGRPTSLSSVITIAQPPAVPGPSQPLTPGALIQDHLAMTSDMPPLKIVDKSAVNGPFSDADNSTRDGEEVSDAFELASADESEPSTARPTVEKRKARASFSEPSSLAGASIAREKAIQGSLSRLLGTDEQLAKDGRAVSAPVQGASANARRPEKKKKSRKAVAATVHLKEERAPIFHDFLKFVYPQ